MKKASKVILTIIFIVYYVAAFALLICGIILAVMIFVSPSTIPNNELTLYIEQIIGEMEVDEETFALIVKGVIAGVYVLSAFFIGTYLVIVASIAKSGAKAKRKGILIANIVFGVLTSNVLQIIGGALGIGGLNAEARAAAQQQAQAQPQMQPQPQPQQIQVQPQPQAQPAKTDWYCPNCGAHNNSKFCQACGTKRPE